MILDKILKQNEKIKEHIKLFKYFRKDFSVLNKWIDNKKSVLISGLRQIGKTTLMKQALVKHGEKAIYLSLNNIVSKKKFADIIDKMDYELKKTIIFIDEIQNLQDWGSEIINIYNEHSHITFIISGSSSITVSDTNGSIRFRELALKPLSLIEYKEFTKAKSTGITLLNEYLGKNAIIGMTNDESVTKKYAKNQYFESYIFQDIVKYEKNINIDELRELIENLKMNTTGEFTKKDLVEKIWDEDTKTNQRKLNHLLDVLIKYNVLLKLTRKNIDGSVSKKNKFYINPHLFVILWEMEFNEIPKEYNGLIIESILIFYKFSNLNICYIKQNNNAKKYKGQEIDIVTNNIWYEVKYSKENIKKELNKLFKEFNQKGLEKKIISLSYKKEIAGIKNINLMDLLLES